MQGKVTKRGVDALKPGRTIRYLWDRTLPGFGVRVTPKGVRSYVFQYKAGGRSRRMTIGQHGAPWTPEDARKKALLLKAEVAGGGDPMEGLKEERQAQTLREFSERYLQEYAEPRKKPLSVSEDRRLLEKVILPRIGRRKLTGLTRGDLARLHLELRRTPYTANRALALLSKMFKLAMLWGVRPEGPNPCRDIERYKERRRERFLSERELARLGKILEKAERAPEGDASAEPWQAIAAIRLLLLTGCRLSEVLGLRWQHVNVDRARLVLPDSKTGAKEVLLSPPALEVLTGLPQTEGNPYCLPGRYDRGHFIGVHYVWLRLRKLARLEGVRLHDLRHTYASVAAAKGESLVIIGALLGHRQVATTARYVHLTDNPVRAAGDRTAGAIASAMSPNRGKGTVVQMPARASAGRRRE